MARFGAGTADLDGPEHLVTLVAPQSPELSAGQGHRFVEDRREDWADVGWRTGDDAQDLGRGGLLLERLAQRSLEAFDLTLRICAWLSGGAGRLQGAGAFLAELRLRTILMLASGTGHMERLPSPDRERPARHCVTAPGFAANARRPGRSMGHGALTLPRPGLGRQMAHRLKIR